MDRLGRWEVCPVYEAHLPLSFCSCSCVVINEKKFICGIDIYKYYINQVLTIPESESIINI